MVRAMTYDHERRESRVPMPVDATTELRLSYGFGNPEILATGPYRSLLA